MDIGIQQQSSDLDHAIAARILEARRRRGVTQEQLAAALGVTFQQVQKYERGVNRLSGGRLITIARALDVDVADLLPEDAIITGGAAPIGHLDAETIRTDLADAIREVERSIASLTLHRSRLRTTHARIGGAA